MSMNSPYKTNLRILLVEDVADDALLLIDRLESCGYELEWDRVDTEEDLLKALEKTWDVVCSDFSMPQFTGAEALRVVRQHDQDVPFIFVSGTIGEDAAVTAMRSGAQDYVMKGNLIRLPTAIDRELRESERRRERRKVEQTLRKLSMVVNQAADSVFITDPEGYIEYVNPAFEELTGYSMEEVRGKTPSIMNSGCHDEHFYANLWGTIHKGEMFRGTIINRRKDGTLLYEEKVITPLKDDNGKTTHYVSTSRDITPRIKAEEDRSRLASILEATPDIVAVLDPGGCLSYLNGAARRLLGVGSDESIEGRCLKDLFPEDMAEKLINEVFPTVFEQGIWSGETLFKISDEEEVPVSQVVVGHYDMHGEVEYVSTIARDISERKRFEAELQYRATHDSLTGLPNRFFLADRFASMIGQASRHETAVAVLFLDMDNFKRVNDSLSHAAGDALLQQVAKRLKSCLRPSDTVARHGGDEFTILIGDLDHPENILVVLSKLRAAFERPVFISNHELYVTFSTGIALFPDDGNRVEDLLRHADTAMYRAKSSGSSQYMFYAPEMNARGHEFLTMEADLRHALEHDEFMLYCQPQIDTRYGTVRGLEALIRWQHPDRGLVSPGDFIPLLENTGLIVPVGEWVLRKACEIHRTWRQRHHQDIRISVNFSASQFNDSELLDKVRAAIREEDMPAHSLEIEITENVVMQDPLIAAEILDALHAMHVRTAIDDFGTGYSSLSYLKRFPLDVLKIDQTFVRDLGVDKGDAAIVEASISLAKKLGLETVAEGVENAYQLRFLEAHGCDLLQGYYFSHPVPPEQTLSMLGHKWQWTES